MTGNELMSGDIVDSNSAWLGQLFDENGIEIAEKITVGDKLTLLIAQIARLQSLYDIVLINGGLGPTQDDLTAQAMALACDCPVVVNPQASQHVLSWCKARGFTANNANLKQAEMPAGASIFPDAPGSAPAFHMRAGSSLIIATPGVPSELKQIMARQVMPFLRERYPLDTSSPWQRYQLFGIGESSLQQKLHDEFAGLTEAFDIGFRANFPYVELKLKPVATASAACKTRQSELEAQLGPCILGPAGTSMAEALVTELRLQGATVASAESCTGGRIASDITGIAGASDVFPGAIVSYANHIKNTLLAVPAKTLDKEGAVSQAVVKSMLEGLFRQTGCDYGIAVSGIAGPGGGSEEKPVGTVWIAWGNRQQKDSICLCINIGREAFQTLVTTIAMDLVRRQLKGLDRPDYLKRWQSA